MSGNASYDRDPKGFFKNLVERVKRLEHRLPPQVVAASGLVPPTVNQHTQIVLRATPENTTWDSWWSSGVRVDFMSFTVESSGVFNDAVMNQIRAYPYAIYDMGPITSPAGFGWGAGREYFYGVNGLSVYIFKGDAVNLDYPGLDAAGEDFNGDYVWMDLYDVGGSDTMTVTTGDVITLALVWWDSWRFKEEGENPSVDIGGLQYAINAALGGVDMNGQSWRSVVYPDDFVPKFEVGPQGYYKTNPMSGFAKGEGAISEGMGNFAVGDGAHAQGVGGNQARGSGAHAEGWGTIAWEYAHAEGRNVRALGQWSHAEGEETTAGDVSVPPFANNGRGAHAEGNQTIALGYYSHTEGLSSKTGQWAVGAHAEGGGTAEAAYSHVDGARAVARRYHENMRGGGWSTDSLLYASRVSGPGYAIDTGSSGYMMIPRWGVGPQEITLTMGRMCRMEIIVLGLASNQSVGACWRIIGLGYLPTSGSARFIGTPTVTKEFGDAGTASWSVSIAVTAVGQVRVTTNAAGTSARWSGLYHFSEIPFDDLHF